MTVVRGSIQLWVALLFVVMQEPRFSLSRCSRPQGTIFVWPKPSDEYGGAGVQGIGTCLGGQVVVLIIPATFCWWEHYPGHVSQQRDWKIALPGQPPRAGRKVRTDLGDGGGHRLCSPFLSGMKTKDHWFPCVWMTWRWANYILGWECDFKHDELPKSESSKKTLEFYGGFLLNIYCSLLLKISKMLLNNFPNKYITGNNILVYKMSEGGDSGARQVSFVFSTHFHFWVFVFFTLTVKMFLFKGAPFFIP